MSLTKDIKTSHAPQIFKKDEISEVLSIRRLIRNFFFRSIFETLVFVLGQFLKLLDFLPRTSVVASQYCEHSPIRFFELLGAHQLPCGLLSYYHEHYPDIVKIEKQERRFSFTIYNQETLRLRGYAI